jgi:hypothetical protein
MAATAYVARMQLVHIMHVSPRSAATCPKAAHFSMLLSLQVRTFNLDATGGGGRYLFHSTLHLDHDQPLRPATMAAMCSERMAASSRFQASIPSQAFRQQAGRRGPMGAAALPQGTEQLIDNVVRTADFWRRASGIYLSYKVRWGTMQHASKHAHHPVQCPAALRSAVLRE